MTQYVLYGLGGADVQYVAIEYSVISTRGNRPISSYMRIFRTYAECMMADNPTIQHVYVIKNRKGLAQEYRDSFTNRKNPIEARAVFRDTLEREGILII